MENVFSRETYPLWVASEDEQQSSMKLAYRTMRERMYTYVTVMPAVVCDGAVIVIELLHDVTSFQHQIKHALFIIDVTQLVL